MEKLVELLNKFEKEKIISEGGRVDEDDEYFGRSLEGGDIVNRSFDPDAHGFFKYQIISKDFKFIDRLVKKDKIDFDEVEQKANFEFTCNYVLKKDEISDKLLMMLAIKDDPLKFLSQIIK